LAFLQAYFDDSGSQRGDRRLYIAGYLNSAGKWALFSEAWDEELRVSPSIEYFKMAEAFSFKNQFDGWHKSDRDEKLRGLARVIRHFQPASFEVSVSMADYQALVNPTSPYVLGNPYFTCCFGMVSTVVQYAVKSGITIPIDFIFDQQQGVDGDIALFFSHMAQNLSPATRKLVSGTPTFKDDKLVLPLQAADMLAWHLRRSHETNGSNMGFLDVKSIIGVDHAVISYEKHDLTRWSEQLSTVPGVSQVQSRQRWRFLKRELVELIAHGYIPPHGTRWKNFRHRAIERISALFSRSR
jgi:hypothetical protein